MTELQTNITKQIELRERAQLFISSKIQKIDRRVLEIIAGDLGGLIDEETITHMLESYKSELEMLNYIKDSL